MVDRDVVARKIASATAHGYATLDHGRLYDEAREGTPVLRQYLTLIADAVGL
ncbi:MAG: hypothetical protein ACRD2T_04410 [Thermoanaerobaculia bacterium]